MRRHYTPPNANLTLAHCAVFTAAMLALFFWGVSILEHDLAARAPRLATLQEPGR